MGKAQKLKIQRRIDRKVKEAEKKQKKVFTAKAVIGFFLFLMLGSLLYFGVGYARERFFAKEEAGNKEGELKVDKIYSNEPEMKIDQNKQYVVKFETNKGNFEATLFAKDAPKTVNNFVFLAREGFYDGSTFHRIIKDFMIQGGDPKGDGTGDPGYKFADEINQHKLVRGALAMANSGPDTNGSQFFIVTKEKADWLDGKHTVFGEIKSGLDVVMNIEKVETGENDKPKDAVVINKILIEES